MQKPETRASLIAGLTDPAAEEVSTEFVGLYRPLIYRVARARGLQDADAEDVTQAVFGRVQGAVAKFESKGPGSFRRGLYTITRNMVVAELTPGPFSGQRALCANMSEAFRGRVPAAVRQIYPSLSTERVQIPLSGFAAARILFAAISTISGTRRASTGPNVVMKRTSILSYVDVGSKFRFESNSKQRSV